MSKQKSRNNKLNVIKRVSLTLFFCLFVNALFAASPYTGIVSPSSGSSKPNSSVTFTTCYFDFDGWQNIRFVDLLINSELDLRNCFYAYYNQNTNRLYLLNDTGTVWLGGFTPGSKNIIENSYAKLDCSGTTISGSGDKLTVKWKVTFKSTFVSPLIKKIYLWVEDDTNANSGWVKAGTWLVGTNSKPSAGSFLPVGVASQPNTPVTFYTFYSDPNGWEDLRYTYFLINTSTSGAKCFYAYYNQNTDSFYLRNDAGTAWLGGFTPGSKNIIENSYARLDCSKADVFGYDNELMISWEVIFKPTFIGTKNVYLSAKDNLGTDSGWVKKGTWIINNPPKINSLTPLDRSTFITGDSINISVAASDPDKDSLQYRYSMDNIILKDWTTAAGYTFKTTLQNKGKHTIKVDITDGKYAFDSKAINIYIYRAFPKPSGG